MRNLSIRYIFCEMKCLRLLWRCHTLRQFYKVFAEIPHTHSPSSRELFLPTENGIEYVAIQVAPSVELQQTMGNTRRIIWQASIRYSVTYSVICNAGDKIRRTNNIYFHMTIWCHTMDFSLFMVNTWIWIMLVLVRFYHCAQRKR